jgi:hypothetical protein
MAGTLVITTLSDGTNSTSATNPILGSAKAWVNFNGADGTRRASYNVSSVTRTATGKYTVNFTNAFADANYCANFSSSPSGGYANSALPVVTQATTNCTVETIWGGAYFDSTNCMLSVFR